MTVKHRVFSRQRMQPLKPSPTVLVLVDFINPMDFPGAENLLTGALNAAVAAARLKRRLSARGVTAIYANDNYGVWHSDFKELVSACQALPGKRGEIASLLAPAECDLTVLKPRHSAFHSTPLDHLLHQLKAQSLVIVGLSTDMCVHLTAMDAYMHGYKVWVPSDCTAAESETSKALALRQMSSVLKCSVRKSGSR
jgi:nicotinamidase-related amidase